MVSSEGIHPHCLNCINLKKCEFGALCPPVNCEWNCGARFHSCKREEHALLCQNVRVPCINAEYGCPQQMPRRHTGAHLHMCPASVTVCQMVWNRWPHREAVHVREYKRNFIAVPQHLDVALALRDQKMLDRHLHIAHPFPPKQGSLISRSLNSHQTQTLTGYWVRRGIRSPGVLELRNEQNRQKTNAQKSKLPNGYSIAAWEERQEFRNQTAGQPMCIPPPPPLPPLKQVTVWLDLSVEAVSHQRVQTKSTYTLRCAQVFRRNEFPWHYRNVHNDIQSGLNGWMEWRCPMAQYGCLFAVRRFHPSRNGKCCVTFSESLECFGIQFDCDAQYSVQQSSRLQFTNLPFEMLQHVAGFLDSMSLYNLSLTCRLLRNVSCSLLERKGLVMWKWLKCSENGKTEWQPSKKFWMFSKAFDPIQHWQFVDNESMSNHMQACPFAQRVEHKSPELLQVTFLQ